MLKRIFTSWRWPRMGWHELVVLLAGASLPLAFTPFDFWPLVFLSLGTLFWSWYDCGARRAMLRGCIFGIGAFAAGVHWVYVSLGTFGGMPPGIAVLMVVAFVLWLSVYTAMAGLIQHLIGARLAPAWRAIIVMPAAWVLVEWIRGLGSLGFSWLAVGYSQTDSPLVAFAPLAGSYAVSLAVAICAGAGVVVIRAGNSAQRGAAFGVIVGIVGVSLLTRGLVFVAPVGAPITIAAVQGNVQLMDKWKPGAPAASLAHYRKLTEEVQDADIVVWPESAIPEFIDRISDDVWDSLRAAGPDYVIGALERQFTKEALIYRNAVISLGEQRSVYRKQHLVPFGEYLPMRPLFSWVLDYLNIPMSDFQPWKGAQALPTLAGRRIGVSVCYEDAFSRDILPALPEAEVLVNVSEDAWFGDSLGPHQRLQMARMRAMEVQRPMIRASNTGVTAAIESDGQIVNRLDQFVVDTLVSTIQPVTGATPFVRYHNSVVLGLLGLMLGGAWLVRWRRTKAIR